MIICIIAHIIPDTLKAYKRMPVLLNYEHETSFKVYFNAREKAGRKRKENLEFVSKTKRKVFNVFFFKRRMGHREKTHQTEPDRLNAILLRPGERKLNIMASITCTGYVIKILRNPHPKRKKSLYKIQM